MSSVKNNIYIYYPGKVYSYNFLYYNSQKDFGEHTPLELYKDNNWDLESYKYVLENYCDKSINSSDNIKNDNYPITTSLYAVTYKNNQNENVQKLLEWILSNEGQEIIEKTGYVGIKQYCSNIEKLPKVSYIRRLKNNN